MRKWIISCCLSFVIASVYAAVPTLDEARELYKAGQYEAAAPTFAKELKRKPKNGSINHWYGVCLYYMGEYEKCEKYLKVGVERKVLLSNYYLGEAYTASYRFGEAVDAYNAYIESLKKAKQEPTDTVLNKLEIAKLGARMIGGVENVQIIDSLSVDSLSFFESYRLTPESGRLLGSDDLPFSLPKDTTVVAYMPQRRDMIFMGYPLADNNYDLCVSSNLIGGQWSELQSLSTTLNTAYNQNYPYLLSDGQTLYFAQDGEKSLGGYDIFITIFNSEREDYMLPQNVGMPFNSTANDFMMAIDETNGIGWFVTDRNKIPGMLTVYIFIPNEEKDVYTGRSEEEIRRLARIASIKDTWVEGANYEELLNAISQIETEDIRKPVREFTFILCNGIVYTQSSDFHSIEALNMYNQARNMQEQITKEKNKLAQLRRDYAEANLAAKDKLRDSILQLEVKLENISMQPYELENQARRAEMSYRNLLQE